MLKIFSSVMFAFLIMPQSSDQSFCNETTRFRCQNGLCLSRAKFCNGVPECQFGEDEFGCDVFLARPEDCKQRNLSMAAQNTYYRDGQCRKPCHHDGNCKGRKRCICDDECGKSCVNPRGLCESEPPSIDHMASFKVYWGSVDKKKRFREHRTPYSYGAFVEYVCEEGYGLEGPTPRCNGRNNWSNEIPACVDFSKCSQAGIEPSLGRVVGGNAAMKNAWPWHVLLTRRSYNMKKSLSNDNIMGGGTIVNKNWILTAAHILSEGHIGVEKIAIFVGLSERPGEQEEIEKSVEAYAGAEYFEHRLFSSEVEYDNDIALIRLGARFDFNMNEIAEPSNGITFKYNIRPVCLPCTDSCLNKKHLADGDGVLLINDEMTIEQKCQREENFLFLDNATAVVTGFGHLNQSNVRITHRFTPPKKLQEAYVGIQNRATCKIGIHRIRELSRSFGNVWHTENMICAAADNVVDACNGDSGGPLVLRTKSCWIQIGIVSFGYGCGREDVPGVYTNVAKYIFWINTIINRAVPDSTTICDQRNTSMSVRKTYYRRGRCIKSCETDGDCGRKRTCICDNVCGLSCVNLNDQCPSEPPRIDHMASYKVYRKSLDGQTRLRENRAPYRYGAFVEYVCEQGYNLVGPIPRCNGRSRWSNGMPVCVIEIVCSNLTPRSGVRLINPTTKWKVGKNAYFACLRGMTRRNLNIQMKIKCLPNGHWSGEQPTCTEIVCDHLTNLSGVRLVNPTAKWLVGKNAYFACLRGLTRRNHNMQMKIACLSNGHWSGELPICTEIVCDQLSSHSGVRLVNPTAKWLMGKTARFACLPGFTRRSDNMQMIIVCLSNGQWSSESPTCVAVDQGGALDHPRLDCGWSLWRKGSCVRTPQGTYRRQVIRVKIKAQNGGRKCSSSMIPKQQTRMTGNACREREYVASQIMKMVGTIREKPRSPGGSTLLQSHQHPGPTPSLCTRTFVSAGGVELLGTNCDDTGNRVDRIRFESTAPFYGSVSSYNHRDILFLVDESGSVGTNNYETELRLVKALANKFCDQRNISSDQTRVALTTFRYSYTHHFDFNEHTTKNNFLSAVDLVRFGGGNSCVVHALEAVFEHYNERTGSRVARNDVDGLVILITGGCFDCYHGGLEAKLKQLRTSFREKDVFVMAFVINVDGSCKDTYKHLFDGSVCFQGFNFRTWKDFENVIEALEEGNDCISRWDKNKKDCVYL